MIDLIQVAGEPFMGEFKLVNYLIKELGLEFEIYSNIEINIYSISLISSDEGFVRRILSNESFKFSKKHINVLNNTKDIFLWLNYNGKTPHNILENCLCSSEDKKKFAMANHQIIKKFFLIKQIQEIDKREIVQECQVYIDENYITFNKNFYRNNN